MTMGENENLEYVVTNSYLNTAEFVRTIPQRLKKNKANEDKIVSLYTIFHLFKAVEDNETYVPKTEAFKHYQDMMKRQDFSGRVLNSSQFGKLLSLLFKNNLKIRRIGSRSSTRYCYFGITLKDSKVINSIKPPTDLRTSNSCIDKVIRFRYLNSNNKFSAAKSLKFNKQLSSNDPLLSDLDDLFRSFLTDSELLESDTIDTKPVPEIILKCFKNSNIFIKEIDIKMFGIMYKDFQDLQIFENIIVKELSQFDKNEALTKLGACIQMFFEEKSNFYTADFSFLKNYFNIVIDSSSNINLLKLKIVNFILQVLKAFNYESFPNILLNFKNLTTHLLRELSFNSKSTFISYWYLLSSMDEMVRVILEYYSLKKMKSG